MGYTTSGIKIGEPIDILGLLREAALAELVAINGYENHIAMSNMQDLNDILRHIRDEEIEHYYIFLNLIRKYDREQEESMKKIKKELSQEHFNEKVGPYKKQSDMYIINALRENIKGELEAINLYENQVAKIKNKEIVSAFRKVIVEEKEHIEELTQVIEKLK